jgi:hypothetical protein
MISLRYQSRSNNPDADGLTKLVYNSNSLTGAAGQERYAAWVVGKDVVLDHLLNPKKN